jgi:DNA invertase Pin-like site-specific DNA recombinase
MMMPTQDKITGRHRERYAYVYIRQSTPKQVQQNQESQRNQYALVQRALDLGWPSTRIHVIDADLGHSGQDGQRLGFQELVAAVSLGRVGMILAYEASRLARNNSDWYTLLDLATVVGTLMADTEGVYDPRQYNDRLLLGLRGLLSEAELHVLHLRMEAGRQRQIERGTYRQSLPTGLLRGGDGRVMKDPDLQVQHTIDLVFTRFVALGSCQKVLRSLRDDGVLLPRRQHGGLHAGQVLWRKPSHAAIAEMLHNPAYAGAFVYGRRGPHPQRRPGQARQTRRPMDAWPTIHYDMYPAYISWEQFLMNQARLQDNASTWVESVRCWPRALSRPSPWQRSRSLSRRSSSALPASRRSRNALRTEKSNPGSVSSRPSRYFQSIRARTASAAWRSARFSRNCMMVTSAKRHGVNPGCPVGAYREAKSSS